MQSIKGGNGVSVGVLQDNLVLSTGLMMATVKSFES